MEIDTAVIGIIAVIALIGMIITVGYVYQEMPKRVCR